MILRRTHRAHTAFLLLLLSYCMPLAAADDFKCQFTLGQQNFDLSSLNTEQKATRTRETPPTTMIDTLHFNICEDLKPQEDFPPTDQCPSGTRACLTKVNHKSDMEDRVVAVIPVAKADSSEAKISALSSPPGVSILLYGSSYPDASDDSQKQSFKVNLICGEKPSDPKFENYDGSVVEVSWTNPAACSSEGSGDNGDNNNGGGEPEEKENVGSGIGWFFLVLLLAFVAYFGLGAYHNYTTYGATGMDLIPHRDFWQEVPYMLRDVVSHLCSSVRPRRSSSRSGYIAV
ncbi:hypothetical protein GYMLUDRAFT_156754 [Collybiopsis luxurians FD-317 M1]|nr:hypothetical protein GYMLUDRAFT_156754 [Collybiopsis luxurians FD-317 M1]